jgi:hypothetical protein
VETEVKIEVGEYVKFYYERGQEAPVIGMGSRAFFKEDVMEALAILKRLRVQIVSGGVYKLENEEIDIAHAWWGTKSQDYEEYEDFIDASYKETLRYINMFDDSPVCQYLFEFNLPFSFTSPEEDDWETWMKKFDS